jgi:hypothetical protein
MSSRNLNLNVLLGNECVVGRIGTYNDMSSFVQSCCSSTVGNSESNEGFNEKHDIEVQQSRFRDNVEELLVGIEQQGQ